MVAFAQIGLNVTKMKLPTPNHVLNMLIKGKLFPVTCLDIFDGGYGYYFDAQFANTTRQKFSDGQQCGIPELGANFQAGFVSCSQKDPRKVRFLIPKW